jgi:hypothetical protein
MRICSTGLQPAEARKTLRVLRSVSTAPIVVIAAWLVAGWANVGSGRTTTQPAGALATGPYSDITALFPAALTARPAKFAAIDEEEDGGDDDQADPVDPNDTLAAADAFWWGAVDATLGATQSERERRPRLDSFVDQVV